MEPGSETKKTYLALQGLFFITQAVALGTTLIALNQGITEKKQSLASFDKKFWAGDLWCGSCGFNISSDGWY